MHRMRTCVKACPFSDEKNPLIRRVRIGKKQVIVKCDLCHGFEDGPLCIKICPKQAVSLNRRLGMSRKLEYGWNGKMLLIDVAAQTSEVLDISELCDEYIGCRGIAAKLVEEYGHPV